MYLPYFFNVDAAVKYLHDCIRKRRHNLRANGLTDPVEWLHPHISAEILGLSYEVVPQVRVENQTSDRNIAGLLLLNEGRIVISEEQGQDVMRFTAAHELGHYLYHQKHHRQHWERAYDPSKPRSREEREADLFAAMFLMPGSLLFRRVVESFGQPPIVVNDNVLFSLCPNQIDPDSSKLDLECALAGARKDFCGRHIVPLHQQFKVSPKAMAIRLQQLSVLTYPTTSYQTDL